jgi:hypothetical protein
MEAIEARSLDCSLEASGRHVVRLQFTRRVSLDTILECHLERRLWERFPVRETRAKLTWYENHAEITVRGELLNISGGGAAISVDVDCPGEGSFWFEIESDGRALDAVESCLVVTSRQRSGSKVARIRFIDACPMELFEFAIHGST